MRLLGARAVALAAVIAAAASCGKVGPPLAPLRPVPVAVSTFGLERTTDRVTVSLAVPNANLDGSTPVRVDSVEIYAVTQTSAAPAPTIAELAVPSYRIARIEVRRADQKAPAANDTRPAAGDPVSYVDTQATAATSPSSSSVRYYAAAGMAGNRRGPASKILTLSLSPLREPPSGVTLDYTEKAIELRWTAATGDRFIVETRDGAGAKPRRATLEPISASEFSTGLEFGKERCFSVRTVTGDAGVTAIGSASSPKCVTPVDRFAPSAPAGLDAFAADAAIELIWTASASTDVVGYIVLRGEGPDGTLQPLVASPMTATQYRDQAVKAGVTYSYQVIAVDGATPPNRSEPSNRKVVTARQPETSVERHRQ